MRFCLPPNACSFLIKKIASLKVSLLKIWRFLMSSGVGAVTALVNFGEVWTPFMFAPSKIFWRSTVTEKLCLRAAKAALTAC